MLEQSAQWFYNDWAANFLDPGKRLFLGYLLSALVLGLCWLVFLKRMPVKIAWKTLFNKNVWLSHSARADYITFTLNALILRFISNRLLGQSAVAVLVFALLHDVFDGRALLAQEIPQWVIATAFTSFLFIFDDFARYLVHRLMHRLPVLWAFHKFHHSATSLNPLTVLRTHPLESVIFTLRGALVQGVSVAIFVYFFGEKVSLLMVLGANAFKFMFNLLGANLRHSEIPIRYWRWLEKVLISPAQHQIHHSIDKQHHDKNFGVTFAFWDVIFNSHCHSSKNQKLRYGLSDSSETIQHPHSLKNLYWGPFKETYDIVHGYTNALINRYKISVSPKKLEV